MVVAHCPFSPKGCNENENWEEMKLSFRDSDQNQNHEFSIDDRVADFYFGYGDEIFVDNKRNWDRWFVTKNDCKFNSTDEKKFNRGFYEEGRYEVAWCMENDDWKKPLQVKLDFYCD